MLLLGRLLYTAFRKCVIPPPMSSHILTVPGVMAAINQVTFSPCLQYMLVMSSTAQAALYCLSLDDLPTKGFQLSNSGPELLNYTQ